MSFQRDQEAAVIQRDRDLADELRGLSSETGNTEPPWQRQVCQFRNFLEPDKLTRAPHAGHDAGDEVCPTVAWFFRRSGTLASIRA